ncbi:hypothetical protein [Actinacidiphila glaucinigra]|uniref:hypothetical protein n=1 Tax=Actinacidiphila glaucinigra TaxID=235986 RepID=UPI0035DEDA92
MAATGVVPTGRFWRWYGAAALASGVFFAVFVQGLLQAKWQVEHPVVIPGDDSPGVAANMGNLIAVPIFAVAAIGCLLFPLLWGIAAFRSWRGAVLKDLPAITTVLQWVALLLALPAAMSLPYSWAGVTALLAADLVAVGVVLRPRWSRWSRRTGADPV